MGDLSSKKPDQELDVLGRVCPYPLVLAKKAMEKIGSGQVLLVKTDAPASAEDSLPRWAEKAGYKLESKKLEDKGYWEIYLQKS